MALSLTGAHGAGKTTLAKKFAEKHSWLFSPSPGSACFKELGLPFVGLKFSERLAVQNLILDRMEENVLDNFGAMVIYDRTPLDACAYFMAEWAAHCTAAEGKEILAYQKRAMKLANRMSCGTMLIQPGIPYVDDGSRPPPNTASQAIHNHLVRSMMYSADFCVPFSILSEAAVNLDHRMRLLHQFWQKVVASAEMELCENYH